MPHKRNKISSKLSNRIQPSKRKRKKVKISSLDNILSTKDKKKKPEKVITRLTIGPVSSQGNKKKRTVTRTKLKKSIFKKLSIDDKNLNRKKYKKLSKWKNILKGYPAFLLGNAPSISKQDLTVLNPYFTIGLNRIFYIYHPTVLLWQDRQLWMSDKKNIVKCKSIKVARNIADPRGMFVNFKLGLNPFRLTSDPSHLYGRGNSGALAAEFAISLGCSSLVILGMDCKYGHKGRTDFYGNNRDHNPYTLTRCSDAMKWLKKYSPVPIYNCSKIKLWPTMTLEEAISKTKPKPFKRKHFENIFRK
jgi:hypothetical protein